MGYIFLFLIWILYFVLHSALAGGKLKSYVKNNFSLTFKYYRILFNLFAITSLIPIFIYQRSIKTVIFYNTTAITQYLGYFIVFLGVILTFLSFKKYSPAEFLGFDFNKKTNDESYNLSTSGLNSYVRHPIYFATLLILWGYFIAKPELTLFIMSFVGSVYLYFGTKLEENKLIIEYGKTYLQYIKDVPMILPWKGKVL